MKKLSNKTKMSVVRKRGDYYYFMHTKAGADNPTFYKIRKANSREADKQNPGKTADVLMDLSKWDKNKKLDFEGIEWSDDGRYMAYMIKTNGSDW